MIQIKNLSKTYIQAGSSCIKVLNSINLNIEAGEVISIIGPSGTGKSTLLRCINGLEQPDKGSELIFDGKRIGMVFQNFNLFNHLTVLRNLTIAPMKLLGLSRLEAEAEAMELLSQVGMAEKANAMPDSLSGGQKQRVAIARCLAMHPDCILFDEPTSALDPTMVGEVLSVIRHLASLGMTMLIVTHEMRFAKDVSTRILFLSNGNVLEDDIPEKVFNHPQHEETLEFLQRIHKLHYELDTKETDTYIINSDVAAFCLKYGISDNIFKLDVILEELLHVITNGHRPLTLDISFSEEKHEISISLLVKGFKESLLEQGSHISPRLIRGLSSDLRETITPYGVLLKLTL